MTRRPRKRRAAQREQRTRLPLLDIPFRQLRNPRAPYEWISEERPEQLQSV